MRQAAVRKNRRRNPAPYGKNDLSQPESREVLTIFHGADHIFGYELNYLIVASQFDYTSFSPLLIN